MFETIYEKNDMNKFISVAVLILSLGCYDTSSKYKEPSYTLIKKLDKIEFGAEHGRWLWDGKHSSRFFVSCPQLSEK